MRWILKFTPSTRDDAANILAAHEEIRGTIDLQTKEGTVARLDANMLGGVLDLGELQVADVMVHRTKMETFDADDPPHRIVDEVLRSQYARVLIWKDEPENIVGVLHTKDLLSALARVNWDVAKLDIMSFHWRALVRTRHHEPQGSVEPVPEAQGADGPRRRRVRRGAGPGHARGYFGGDRRPDHRRARYARSCTSGPRPTAPSMSTARCRSAT